MINRIKKFISNKDLFGKDNKLLLAISGGADSIFLFFVLKELGYKIEVAHCNFNLRAEESDEDENFVKTLAKNYGVQCYVKSFEVQKYAKKERISIQMAARELRYNWFDKLRLNNNFDFILTAHHRDDNIETFLMNLIRGTGIHGLCGIKTKNKYIIRPLLEISRDEIEAYLTQKEIRYRSDSSNSDIKYTRNKIRHELIPLLKKINPSIQKTIIDEIYVFNQMSNFFQKEITEITGRLLMEKDGVYRIKISKLLEIKHLEVVLFEILKHFGFFQVSQIIRALHLQSGKQFFSDAYQLIIDREEIIISLIEKIQEDVKIDAMENEIHFPFRIRFNVSTDISLDHNANIAKLDFSKLTFPLRLRKWQHGDRFKPLGMNNFKKLSDFFIDNKFSLVDKKKQWILCSEDDIIWIAGVRIDDRYKIDSNTKKVYIAELLREQ